MRSLPSLFMLLATAMVGFAVFAGPAVAETKSAVINVKAVFPITPRDIVDIVADGTGDLRLMLSPKAAQRFEDFTWRNFGEKIKVTAGDKVLVEAVVRAPVTTGVIVITTKGATDAAETRRLLKKK